MSTKDNALPHVQSPFADEAHLIAARRRACSVPTAEEATAEQPEGSGYAIPLDAPVFGVALSGGGIRSATFSLGVLQTLASLGLLKRVDYLSTVSGGGYIGSFLGGLFCARGGNPKGFRPSAVEAGLKPSADPGAPVFRCLHWLRENGRYLTPGGSGDAFLAAATVARNWIAAMAVMALFGVMVWMALDVVWMALRTIGGASGPVPWLKAPVLGLQIWRSPWWGVLPVVLLVGLVFGWAYFLVGYPKATDGRRWGRLWGKPWWVAGVGALAMLAFFIIGATRSPEWPAWLLMGLGMGVVLCLSALLVHGLYLRPHSGAERRRRLSRAVRFFLLAAAILAAVAVVDSLGWTLAMRAFQSEDGGASFGFTVGELGRFAKGVLGSLAGEKGENGLILGILGLATALLRYLTGKQEKEGAAQGRALAAFLPWALALVATCLGLFVAGLGAALAHGLWFHSSGAGLDAMIAGRIQVVFFLVLVGMNLLVGQVMGFLNQSTLGPFYTAALTRAYLGASNPQRWQQGNRGPERFEGDDIAREAYRPDQAGGPLHLLNATLNMTTGGTSQVAQRDRKGINVALGPAGLSVGVENHAEWTDSGSLRWNSFGAGVPAGTTPPAPFLPEPLSIGQWVGISGAAFTTGLGSGTTLATSLLAGLLNVRLGYWWRPGGEPPTADPNPSPRRIWESTFPVQSRIFEEWIALFPGTSSTLWYLSDGGHFENTAAYELIRRQLPVIVVCDNGQDPGSGLEDVANLVAKARSDFGAEVEFLDLPGLDEFFRGDPSRKAYGSLDQLLDPERSALAALARIRYRGEGVREGLLILLKPTLAPDLPMDLRNYAVNHPPFPQQTTLDQFFDERQWESYRKLGETIALRALGAGENTSAPWVRRLLQ